MSEKSGQVVVLLLHNFEIELFCNQIGFHHFDFDLVSKLESIAGSGTDNGVIFSIQRVRIIYQIT